MSTRDDARLTAQERAALSNLEALAAADDPQLAARLRGPGRLSIAVHAARLRALFAWARMPVWLSSPWAAVPALVAGLVLVVAGVSLGWGVGVVGALLSTVGLAWLVRYASQRLGLRRGG